MVGVGEEMGQGKARMGAGPAAMVEWAGVVEGRQGWQKSWQQV